MSTKKKITGLIYLFYWRNFDSSLYMFLAVDYSQPQNVWIRSFYSTGRKENRCPVIQLLHYRHYRWHNVCNMYAESPVDLYSRIPGVNKIVTHQVLYVYALIFARISLPNLIDTGTDLPAFGKCSTEVTVGHQIFLSLSVSAFDCSA